MEKGSKVDDLSKVKQFLKEKVGFSEKELQTLERVKPILSCGLCQRNCGTLAVMDNCSLKICTECLDNLYDDSIGKTKDSSLFACPHCQKKIFEITYEDETNEKVLEEIKEKKPEKKE